MAFALAGTRAFAATVTTDQPDYAPGTTVNIAGSGFQPGETVQVQVINLTNPGDTGAEHDPWTVTADESGDFTSTWLVTPDENGTTLQLTATGLTSGLVAQVAFTDANITAATGGSAISADTTAGTWTALTGPTVSEVAIGDISAGTLILNVPPGFVFDTNSPVPNVKLTGGDNTANKNINSLAVGATNSVVTTPTNITFTISSKSSGQTLCTLLFQNLRVRPTAGTPLASGSITNSGSATQAGGIAITNNFGTLVEVAGVASKLAFTNAPITTTAGVASGNLTVQRQDQFGNAVTNEGTRTVTLSSSSTGTVTFSPSSLSINSGSSTASFTYTDTKIGSPTITAASTSPTTLTSATQSETITKASATISGVTASQSINYGTATVALSGTVSGAGSVYPTNGEVVSITINSTTTNAVVSGGAGGFSVNFSTALIPYSASAYTITYAYAGDANLNAATNNTSTALTVNKTAVSITANNDSKTYGQTKTYGAGQTAFSSSGLQNGETVGSVTITASGGTNASAAVGAYTLIPSGATGGTFNGANYSITYGNGTLTVNKAAAAVSVSSSMNPSGYLDAVSFTATLPADSTGNVVFVVGSTPISTNAISSGSATSAATTSLPRGTNTITARYAGDGNYLGATNTLAGGQVVTNHPPVAGSFSYTNGAAAFKLSIASLLSHVTDADGDAILLTGFGASTNGISIVTNATLMQYRNTNNVNDRFTYLVSDGFGGTATGTVSVVFSPFLTTGQSNNVVVAGGVAHLKYFGIPGYRYGVERSTNLVNWTQILTTNAPSNGAFNYQDTFSDLAAPPASAYYRLKWTP